MTVDPSGPTPSAGTPAPRLVFESVTIKATCSSKFDSLIFEFAAEFLLSPQDYGTPHSAVLTVDVVYDSLIGWTFSGGVDNLNVACLYPLFPETQSDAIMNVLEGITVSTLQVDFNHCSESTSFSAQRVIQLGGVELELIFNRGSESTGLSEWDFTATLIDNYETSSNKLGTFLAGVSPAVSTEIPDFIQNIGFDIPKDSSITLECMNLGDATSHFILLSIVVKVPGLEFAFVQINSAPQATGDELPDAQAPKRLFKFTMENFPDVAGVPMLDTLSQPFDQMDFFWTSDELTRDEVAQINGRVFSNRNYQLVFVEPTEQTSNSALVSAFASQSPTDIVIVKGCHFQVIVEENNLPTPVLDYNFAGSKSKAGQVVNSQAGIALRAPTADTVSIKNGSASGPWTKTVGPLTISAIGLTFNDSVLQIMLDAAVKLGPIAATIKGFSIRFTTKDLHSVDIIKSQVDLTGISVDLKRPPIGLAGMLVEKLDNRGVRTGFEGGVSIQVQPYTFIAAGGYYDNQSDGKGGTFKSLMVFTELDGPIAELEVATLEGLTGGVGYNSQISLPTIDNMTTFPFINSDQRR